MTDTKSKDINSPLIKGYRHVLELPNGWFVMVDMRDDEITWTCHVLDTTGDAHTVTEMPAKVLKGLR